MVIIVMSKIVTYVEFVCVYMQYVCVCVCVCVYTHTQLTLEQCVG